MLSHLQSSDGHGGVRVPQNGHVPPSQPPSGQAYTIPGCSQASHALDTVIAATPFAAPNSAAWSTPASFQSKPVTFQTFPYLPPPPSALCPSMGAEAWGSCPAPHAHGQLPPGAFSVRRATTTPASTAQHSVALHAKRSSDSQLQRPYSHDLSLGHGKGEFDLQTRP